MSRNRKPAEVHVLHGTRSRAQSADSPPKPEPVNKLPRPPVHLSRKAKAKWKEKGTQLMATGVLCVTDLDMLEAYCISYEMVLRAKDDLKGSLQTIGAQGLLTKHPAATVLKEQMAEMRAVSSLLGLNPASRTKVGGTSDKDVLDDLWNDV